VLDDFSDEDIALVLEGQAENVFYHMGNWIEDRVEKGLDEVNVSPSKEGTGFVGQAGYGR